MSLNNATTDSQEGRLELCINNAWGTVCDSLFDENDAAVACSRIAGFSQQGTYSHTYLRMYGYTANTLQGSLAI
ncbi:MAG: scavenger receptor cysteine-rich domain-containing protein [Methylococcales symbiont of Iophon sp. n. MRB-2018]|nr:MAG: scavenger receptor cysteine-rich domain-containing protein [Methylococcales symbiont of Iophon sp. n. MRB-2018]